MIMASGLTRFFARESACSMEQRHALCATTLPDNKANLCFGLMQAQQPSAPHPSLALPASMVGTGPARIARPPLAPITSNENSQLSTASDEVRLHVLRLELTSMPGQRPTQSNVPVQQQCTTMSQMHLYNNVEMGMYNSNVHQCSNVVRRLGHLQLCSQACHRKRHHRRWAPLLALRKSLATHP